MKGRGILALVVAVLGCAFAAPQALAVTFTVDDDASHCIPDFTEIQPAVDAAALNPGVDTVRVCPGTYDESVTITTQEIVRASSAHPDVGRCNGNRTNSNRTFVTGNDGNPDNMNDPGPDSGPAFTIQANKVQLLNFVIQDVENDLGGVFVSPTTSGHLIQTNLFQDNQFGLYLNASGAFLTNVIRNCFRDNNLGTFGVNAAVGNGIYSDQGLANTTIASNLFFNNTSAGILLTYVFGLTPPPTTITVRSNISRQDGEFGFFGLTDSTVRNNILQGPVFRGFFFGPATTNVTVQHNIIQNVSDGHGIRIRNRFDDMGFPTMSSGLTVRHNIIQGTTEKGIFVEESALDPGTFESNIVQRTGEDGIRVDTGNANLTFRRNIVQSAGWDGVFIADGATPITLERNIFQNSNQNGPDTGGDPFHDCHDDNGPPTPNTWTRNIGRTQNQDGLCIFATTTPPFSHP